MCWQLIYWIACYVWQRHRAPIQWWITELVPYQERREKRATTSSIINNIIESSTSSPSSFNKEQQVNIMYEEHIDTVNTHTENFEVKLDPSYTMVPEHFLTIPWWIERSKFWFSSNFDSEINKSLSRLYCSIGTNFCLEILTTIT